MRSRAVVSIGLGTILAAACIAQQYPPPPQYPPQQQQYPAQQPQYPQPQQQYPQPQYPAQGQYAPPPAMAPQQLDQLVAPIALYPDGLLAQVLTASTFSNQIPDAAGWANQHTYLQGDAVSQAIQQDNLPWDPSVLALLPFPQVLSYMAQYMSWTQQLGNAVLEQRADVMDAVQRKRQEAYDYGYLRDPQFTQYERVQVLGPGNIEILPAYSGYYYVPYYNPVVVYSRPRPGFVARGVFRFGSRIAIGASFAPFGWGGVGFGWREHNILIDRRPWGRTWSNRGAYAHPYATPYRRAQGPGIEHHERGPARNDHGDRGERGRDGHRDDHR
jgi:uncharacterized protein DUF3300